jgi:hypothetical protein
MPKNARVDVLLDDVQLVRVEMQGRVIEAINALTKGRSDRALVALAAVYNDLRDGDDAGRGGGELYRAIQAVRSDSAIRRARAREEVTA